MKVKMMMKVKVMIKAKKRMEVKVTVAPGFKLMTQSLLSRST